MNAAAPLFYAGEALSLAIRDCLMERWKITHHTYKTENCRRVFYLSMEFLMGRTLSNAMLNLGVTDTATQAMYDLGIEIEELIESEPDAGLGNGGLGRLAACIIDSCATLQLPVICYVCPEWHLLKLLRVAILKDFFACLRPRFHQSWIGFWSFFHSSWFDPTGTISHALFGDQHQ